MLCHEYDSYSGRTLNYHTAFESEKFMLPFDTFLLDCETLPAHSIWNSNEDKANFVLFLLICGYESNTNSRKRHIKKMNVRARSWFMTTKHSAIVRHLFLFTKCLPWQIVVDLYFESCTSICLRNWFKNVSEMALSQTEWKTGISKFEKTFA